MPVDEFKIGEINGKVDMLVTAVYDMKSAVILALEKQQKDIDEHKEKDLVVASDVQNILNWKNGTNGDIGAKQTLDNLEKGKLKLASFIGGIAFAGGVAGSKAIDFVTKVFG